MTSIQTYRVEIKSDFDLAKNLKARPFLFFFDERPERKIWIGNKLVTFRFRQHGETLNVETDKNVDSLEARLEKWFGIREDLSEFYGLCRKDAVLKNYLGKMRGIGIFSAPDDFEALVCIICSQFTGFPQYKAMTKKIYESCGFFPRPSDILEKPELLDGCGLGYRKKYVLELARKFPEWGPGLGHYSRSIFTLFQKRDYSSFYDDSLIRKIASEYYGFEGKNVMKFADENWGKWSGLAEVFLQKFLRDLKPAACK